MQHRAKFARLRAETGEHVSKQGSGERLGLLLVANVFATDASEDEAQYRVAPFEGAASSPVHEQDGCQRHVQG